MNIICHHNSDSYMYILPAKAQIAKNGNRPLQSLRSEFDKTTEQ